ncbi:MAG: hypothetical protein EOP48_05515 [Sphingobacteriales bacterium]|nr:MAG: hypothetical protein EOP48_05515 [Sphingobacteriales bacterium]
MENSRSLSSLFSSSHTGCVHPSAFARASTAFNEFYDEYNTTLASFAVTINAATSQLTLPAKDLSITQNKWCYIMDLESIPTGNREGILHEFMTRGNGSSVLRLQIASALPAVTHTFNTWSEIDTTILISPNLFQTATDQ